MKLTEQRVDELVAGLSTVRDEQLEGRAHSPGAEALFERIVSAPAQAPDVRRRPRRRRVAVLSIAAALVLAAGGAGASLLFSSEQQATAEIECFQPAEWGGGSVAQEPAFGQDPVAFCRRVLAGGPSPVPPLVACAGDGTVAVIAGESAAACAEKGFHPLAAGYERQRQRVTQLQHAILRLEARVDCLPPAEFANRVQQLLDRMGWDGWTTRLRDPGSAYPCGAVTNRGGGIRRTLAGGLRGSDRVVMIHAESSRSIDNLLYGVRDGIFLPLVRRSGASCFTTDELTRMVERAAGLRVRVAVGNLGSGEFDDARQLRYEEGCSVMAMLEPTPDPKQLRLTIYRKG